MNMYAHHLQMPEAAGIAPLSFDDLRAELTDAGLIIEHHYNLGLICLWYNWLPPSFSEMMEEEGDQVCATLGAPAWANTSDFQMWLECEEKFGWLIKANRVFQPNNDVPAGTAAAIWVYHNRLDLAVHQAIQIAKGLPQ